MEGDAHVKDREVIENHAQERSQNFHFEAKNKL